MADDLEARREEFFERIDCRFPYNDRAAASALIREALSISANASFAVLEEISRLPQGAKVERRRQRELCAEWDAACAHPLKDTVLPFARSLIDGPHAPAAKCSAAMRMVAEHLDQWAALNIIYFAASDEDAEAMGEMESLFAAEQGGERPLPLPCRV